MDKKRGRLFIFSAPSGSGKTTIVREVMQRFPEFMFSVSATTRPPRAHEREGIDYYFLSPEEFQRHIDADAFLEWEEVYPGRFYGTMRKEVERIFSLDRLAIFDVDVQGGVNIKENYGDEAVAVFVQVPNLEVLRERLESRATDHPEDIEGRLAKAAHELTFAQNFDYILINDQLEQAIDEACRIVEERSGIVKSSG